MPLVIFFWISAKVCTLNLSEQKPALAICSIWKVPEQVIMDGNIYH